MLVLMTSIGCVNLVRFSLRLYTDTWHYVCIILLVHQIRNFQIEAALTVVGGCMLLLQNIGELKLVDIYIFFQSEKRWICVLWPLITGIDSVFLPVLCRFPKLLWDISQVRGLDTSKAYDRLSSFVCPPIVNLGADVRLRNWRWERLSSTKWIKSDWLPVASLLFRVWS